MRPAEERYAGGILDASVAIQVLLAASTIRNFPTVQAVWKQVINSLLTLSVHKTREGSYEAGSDYVEGQPMADLKMRLSSKTTFVLYLTVMLVTAASAAAPQHFVSQKSQVFTPGELDIKRGDTMEIVNDDGDLLHHLYVDTKQLQYDSGDQEPGAKVDITFPATGTFDVLCGIHPKMRLIVHVN